MSDSDPRPPSRSPRETIWEAIVGERVTPDIAAAMFALLSPDHDEDSGSLSEQELASAFRLQFMEAVAGLAAATSPEAKLVLAHLVESGGVEEASRRFEILLGQIAPGEPERIAGRLLTKAALFGPADTGIAIDACERALVLRPDDVPTHLVAAGLYTMTGDLAAAERSYRTILSAPQVDRPFRADVLVSLADVVGQLGRQPESETLIADSLAIHAELQGTAATIGLMLIVAEDAEKRRDYASEKRWRTALLSVQKEAGDSVGAAATLTELATDAADRGDLDAAAAGFREAETAWKRAGDKANRAWTLWRHGLMEEKRDRFDTAEKLFERAFRLEKKLEDTDAAIATLTSLADLAERRGRMDEAERHLERSLAMAEEAGDHEHAGQVSARLGGIARGQNRARDDVEHFRRAAEHYERAGKEGKLANALGALGMGLAAIGDLEGAEAALDRARAIFDRLDDRSGLGVAFLNLAVVSQLRSDLGSAEHRYSLAASIFTELDDQERGALAYQQVGDLCYKRGDIEGARSNWMPALSRYTNLGRRDGEEAQRLIKALDAIRSM